MAVRPSQSQEVARLIAGLSADDATRRESASARLAVIGVRAVEGLIRVAADVAHDVTTRSAALSSLSAIGDLRAVPTAATIVERRESPLLPSAIELLGGVADRDVPEAALAIDRLTGLALDQAADPFHRRLAASALGRLPDRLLTPLRAVLGTAIPVRHVSSGAPEAVSGDRPSLAQMLARGLPAHPSIVTTALRHEWRDATLTTIRRLVDWLREQEMGSSAEDALAWLALRGEAHRVLAERGSRLAIDDLRQTIANAETPLPVGFSGAVAALGDASCLEAVAAAWLRATPASARLWRTHLADAFGAIVRRESVTRGHRTLLRILTQWPETAVLVAKAAKAPHASKTTRGRRLR